ncbi:MAG: thiolase family protein [Phycisphaerae bacterium]|nr:thiolase family protein [Phycisphaerae bacterium]
MPETLIVAAKRSAIGRFLGTLSPLSAMDIGAQVARQTLESIGAKPDSIDEVFVGQVLQAGCGHNPARQVALGAGLPESIRALTLNQVCGSGLQSVMTADRAIRAGDIHVALAGGIENMSNSPHLMRGVRTGAVKFGNAELIDVMIYDGLTCVFDKWAMGVCADDTARRHNVSRQAQDEYAVESHKRASKARAEGFFKRSIVPIAIKSRKETITFDVDETIRDDASLDAMAKLAPAFGKDGTVTAGNASAISDGAAMTIVASDAAVKKYGWKPRARIVSQAVHYQAPKDLFIAPVGAAKLALERAKLTTKDIDLFEINEAFATQVLADIRMLDIDHGRVNAYGGGISLGHPIGASGARCLSTLLDGLEHRNAKRGLVALCMGGGGAVAMVVERV